MMLRRGGLYVTKRAVISWRGVIVSGEIVMFIGSYPIKKLDGGQVKGWAEVWLLHGETIDKVLYKDSVEAWEKDWKLVC